MILTLRTDSPTAYITLLDDQGIEVKQEIWQADRTLADNLHRHIDELLRAADSGWEELAGILVYRGPGSFTGLRIGITVANALAYGLDIPVIGETSDEWQGRAFSRLQNGGNDRIVLPHYGADPNITRPKV